MNKKVFITGASGYVGARIYSDLKKIFDVTGVYNSTKLFPELIHLDITDKVKVIKKVKEIKPDWVIHIAADPKSSSCAANPEKAIRLNEGGTRNIVEAANQISAKVVYFSSVAAINPIDLYGETKLAGEKIAKTTIAGWVILRPSLIIGFSPNTSNDRYFNRLLKSIKGNAPAIFDTSCKYQPTYLGQISEVTKRIVEKGILNETIPITVPEIKTRYEIAKDILGSLGNKAAPKDDKDQTPLNLSTQEKLKELDLPVFSYSEIIEKIIKETRTGLDIV